jgi:hypothetical protein
VTRRRTGSGRLASADPGSLGDEDLESIDFFFDGVLGDDVGQAATFEEVALPVVTSVLGQEDAPGRPGCVILYGHAGTGRAHTLFGSGGESRGLLARSLARVFEDSSVAAVDLSAIVLDGDRAIDLLSRANAATLTERSVLGFSGYSRALCLTGATVTRCDAPEKGSSAASSIHRAVLAYRRTGGSAGGWPSFFLFFYFKTIYTIF